jgi:hypothetical protein
MRAVNVPQTMTEGNRRPKRPENALKLLRSDFRGEQVQAVCVRMPTVSAMRDLEGTNLTERPGILHNLLVSALGLERPKRLQKPFEHRFDGLPVVVGESQGEEPRRAAETLDGRDSPLNLDHTPRGDLDRTDRANPVARTDHQVAVER